MEITQELIQELARQVKILLANESQGVGEITIVPSLDGIVSLPALKIVGDEEEVVEAPLSLLKVHLRAHDNEIQWKLGDNGAWDTLVRFPDIMDIPTLRTNSNGIQWKYEKEDESAWRDLVSYDTLKLKFTDLTEEQIDQLRLHYSDLTAEQIAELQKPATDAAQELRDFKGIIESQEEARQKAEELRKQQEENRQQEETKRDTAETIRTQSEQQREKNETVRITNENNRITAETARDQAESARQTAEAARNQAESGRVTAEQEREENTRQALEESGKATDRLHELSNNRDKVIDGYWWTYNEETKEYENTGEIAKGNLMYATFAYQDGHIYMRTDPEYDGPGFRLDDQGHLKVKI